MPKRFLLLISIALASLVYAEDATLRIGVIFPFSGKQARQGELGKVGIELALRELSDFHPEVFYEDSHSDTNQAVSAFHKLRTMNQVDAVLTMGSPAAMALLPLVNQSHTVLLAMVVVSDFSAPGDYGFRLMGTAGGFARAIADLLQTQLSKRKIALIYVEDDYGIAYEKVLRTALGPNLVAAEGYLPSSTDFRTTLLRVRTGKPDAIVLASWGVEAGMLLRQAKDIGLVSPVFVCPSACDNPDIAASGAGATDPLVIVASASRTSASRTNVLLEAFHESPTSVVLRFFDAIVLLRHALGKCTNASNRRDCLKTALAETQNVPGSSYPIAFDVNGDIVDSYELKLVRDGKLVPARVEGQNVVVQ